MDILTSQLSTCVDLVSNASFAIKFSISVGLAFSFYYKTRIAKVPRLIGKNGNFKQFIQKHVPLVHETFSPFPLFCGSTLQTVGSTLLRARPKINWDESEDLDLPDQGQVHLTWMHGAHHSDYSNKEKPTVILLPGLTGSVDSNYICHFVKHLDDLNFRAVVFSYRGMGGKGLKTAKTYCACYTDDMVHVVDHVKAKYPQAPVVAVGISLGAMILTHYLIRTRENSRLAAAMSISVPWNTFESKKSLLTPLNRLLFNRHLTRRLLQSIEKHLPMFSHVTDADHVRESSTIHEFDESFTRRVFGFESLDHYYSAAMIADKVDCIKTPLLALNAFDDPFSPGHSIPVNEIVRSDYVTLVLTERGGHVAFLDTRFPWGVSYMDRMFKEYVQAVFNNLDLMIDSPPLTPTT